MMCFFKGNTIDTVQCISHVYYITPSSNKVSIIGIQIGPPGIQMRCHWNMNLYGLPLILMIPHVLWRTEENACICGTYLMQHGSSEKFPSLLKFKKKILTESGYKMQYSMICDRIQPNFNCHIWQCIRHAMTSEANRLKELILPNIRVHNCISIMFKAIPATYPNKAHIRLYQQKGLPRAPSNLTPYPQPPYSLHFMRPLSEMFPSKNYMHGLRPLGVIYPSTVFLVISKSIWTRSLGSK